MFCVCYDTDPWEHIAFGVVGGALFYQGSEYDKRNRLELLEMMEAMDKFGKPGEKFFKPGTHE